MDGGLGSPDQAMYLSPLARKEQARIDSTPHSIDLCSYCGLHRSKLTVLISVRTCGRGTHPALQTATRIRVCIKTLKWTRAAIIHSYHMNRGSVGTGVYGCAFILRCLVVCGWAWYEDSICSSDVCRNIGRLACQQLCFNC